MSHSYFFVQCLNFDLQPIRQGSQSSRFKSRYLSFLRMIRQWRHLKELKRGGRGNDCFRRVGDTKTGELAVTCIACPAPGINLPEGWENVGVEQR